MRTDTPEVPEAADCVTGWVVTGWEACASFAAGADGSPVCAGCGWLAEEHEPAAEVRVLRPRPVPARPRRLAS